MTAAQQLGTAFSEVGNASSASPMAGQRGA